MSKRIAIVLVIGLGILGLYLLVQSFSSPLEITGDRDTANNSGTMTGTDRLQGEGEAKAPEADPSRVAVPEDASTSGSRPGTLLVRARWGDGTPAAGVAIALGSWEPVYHMLTRRMTDQVGIVEFKNLKPGGFGVLSDRVRSAEIMVEAGKVAEVTLELKGVDVEGLVVDGSGAAVADAGIWLTNGHSYGWLGGRVVTRSDGQGRFRIRGVPQDQSVGALASGFAPSDLVDLDDLDVSRVPVQVRLVVAARGGGVSGSVRFPSGEPVPGADISVGTMPRQFRYRRGSRRSYVEAWTPLTTCSDENGCFELPSVAPGKHPVAVRAQGWPIWKGEAVVEVGATTHLDVQLVRGVMVQGVVKDGAGKPVGRATVRAYDRALDEVFVQIGQFDYQNVFGFPFVAADANGRYRLAGIPSGPIHLYATPPRRSRQDRTVARAKTILQGKDGEELRWDPVIEQGHSISGLVTYKNGAPMSGCFVTLQNEKTGRHQAAIIDKEGRFLFTNLEPAYYKVWVQYHPRESPEGTPPVQRNKIWPDTGELHLVATFDKPLKKVPASVTGRLHDAAGRHVHAGTPGVLLQSSRRSRQVRKADKEGAFRFDKVSPGRYRLVIMSGEQMIHFTDWFELTPAQKHDVGTILTRPGGCLRIRFLREKGIEKLEPQIWARHVETGQFRRIQPAGDGEQVQKNLCTGRYEVHVYGKHIAHTRVTAEVTEGEEVAIELPLRRGLARTFEIRLPEELGGKIDVRVRDAGGRVCWEVTYNLSAGFPNPYKPKLYLAPGRYMFKVKTTAGLAGEQAFEVKDIQTTAHRIRIPLKR